MRTLCLAVTCLLGSALAALAQTSFTQQVYAFELQGMTWQELAGAGVTYVTHVPATAQTAADAHRWGVKIMPYVSLYKVIDTRLDPGYLKEPFWKEVDLAQHPDWALIRPDGKVRIPFDDPNYPKGIFQSCCNQPGIADAYVKGVEQVIATGADGVFVDNVHPYPRCYGPDLGLHQHLDPAKSNTEMYKLALMRVFRAVKAHGPAFMTMLNSGGPSHDYESYGDTLMWESFVFRWPEATWKNHAVTCRTHDWKAVVAAEKSWRDFTTAGGSIAPLTYLPVRELEQPHAYLAFVCAKLCNFQQWTCSVTERQDTIRQLYRTDLGSPAGPLENDGPVYFRRYAKGLVAGNSSTETVQVSLPWVLRDSNVADQYSGDLLTARDGKITVTLPSDCGRVYVTRDAYLANVLGEAASMAQSCALHLEQGAASDPEIKTRQETCLAAYKQASECLRAVKQSGLPADKAGRQRLAALPRLLDSLAPAPIPGRSLETRLLAGEPLQSEEFPALLAVKGKPAFSANVGTDSAILSSGAATFAFSNGGNEPTFRLGTSTMTLWAGPGNHSDERWLHARRLQDFKLITDTPTEKTLQFVVRLYGQNTGAEISDCDVQVTATIRAGVPGVVMQTALRNHTDKPVSAYWFWTIGGRLHTSPQGATVTSENPPMVKDAAWHYMHADPAGGGGLLLTEWSSLGHGYLFANPKTQTVPPGGEMPINWTAYVLTPPAGNDAFMQQRSRWYRQYASLAAEVATGVQSRLQMPGQAVAGVPLSVTLALSGAEAKRVVGPRFALKATAGARALTTQPVADQPGVFTVEIPADLPAEQRVDFEGMTSGTSGGAALSLTTCGTLRVKPALEVLDVRQAAAEGGAGFAVSVALRNNLPRPLPVSLKLIAIGLPDVPAVMATLPVGAEETPILVTAPGVALPTGAAKIAAKLTVTYEVEPGQPLTATDERELALTPQASCQTAANPPTIDGKLDDSAWNFSTRLTGFVDNVTGQPAREPTTCQVMNDDQNLYVGFVCSQADMVHLRANAKPDANGLNPNAPADDSIEVYLDPHRPGGSFFRLCVNSLGAAKCDGASGGWTVAVTKDPDRWTVELKLPFKVIGATLRPGDQWGFNACRNNQNVNEATSWSWTQGSYSKPERFGGLRFTTGGH